MKEGDCAIVRAGVAGVAGVGHCWVGGGCGVAEPPAWTPTPRGYPFEPRLNEVEDEEASVRAPGAAGVAGV